jgi:hypothetical protein
MYRQVSGRFAMTIPGHIENGNVVWDTPVSLPNGTKVTIMVEQPAENTPSAQAIPSLYERLQSVVGKAHDLPADLAMNHDHYLHGQAKRQ